MAIYDPSAKVGTALAERRHERFLSQEEKRKEDRRSAAKAGWEVAKSASKYQRESLNTEMFQTFVPGYESSETSLFQLNPSETLLQRARRDLFRTREDYGFSATGKRFLADLQSKDPTTAQRALEKLPPGMSPDEWIAKSQKQMTKQSTGIDFPDFGEFFSEAGEQFKSFKSDVSQIAGKFGKKPPVSKSVPQMSPWDKASKEFEKEFYSVDISGGGMGEGAALKRDLRYGSSEKLFKTRGEAKEFFMAERGIGRGGKARNLLESIKTNKPITAVEELTGYGQKGIKALPGKLFGAGMGGLQAAAGVQAITDRDASFAKQVGGATNIALGANAMLAFGGANIWNPAGVAAIGAGIGASLLSMV